jgi:transcription elongation factor GreA
MPSSLAATRSGTRPERRTSILIIHAHIFLEDAVIQDLDSDSKRLGQIAAQYLGRLPAGQRELAASEINRFVRHVGAERPVANITKLEVERYQQYLADTAGDAATRVEALKTFLSDLKAKKLTETNLGAGLRVRRRGGTANARKEEAAVVELTREGLEQLQAELERLETEVAPAVRNDLAAAYQDRDFRENAPYDEAKRRMGEVQGQIERLRGQIKAARVVERETSNERAGLGSKVVLRDLQFDEELDYTLVGPGEVDTRNRRISIQSPVGSALKDRAVGDTVEVDIPSGKARYRIERIEQAT